MATPAPRRADGGKILVCPSCLEAWIKRFYPEATQCSECAVELETYVPDLKRPRSINYLKPKDDDETEATESSPTPAARSRGRNTAQQLPASPDESPGDVSSGV